VLDLLRGWARSTWNTGIAFGTVGAEVEGARLEITTFRADRYDRESRNPVVAWGDSLVDDLARRDFTVNAMAIPLRRPELIDPQGGLADLEAGLLRALHPGSFRDDPTRALRAARYAARFGFSPEPQTLEWLRSADLGAVSADRRDADLLRIAAEPHPAEGFQLLEDWGLLELRPEGAALVAAVTELLESPPWRGAAEREAAAMAAALGPARGEGELAQARPASPSEAVGLARGHDPVELALARALGAAWLDRYLLEWRAVSLEIDGADLVSAGIPEGPAVGHGLAVALRRKLDGEIGGREAELETALDAARSSP
jgi:hypothetical protein